VNRFRKHQSQDVRRLVKLLVRFGRTKKIMENMYRVLEKAVEELLIWVLFCQEVEGYCG
jgi:hypothetical protein